jgi:hypothetical protein
MFKDAQWWVTVNEKRANFVQILADKGPEICY